LESPRERGFFSEYAFGRISHHLGEQVSIKDFSSSLLNAPKCDISITSQRKKEKNTMNVGIFWRLL
jgi:hypothetical protein